MNDNNTRVTTHNLSELKELDVVRVKVKKYDGVTSSESKKFSIDPQLTNFEVLRILLSKAFDLKDDFVISYLVRSRKKRAERFLPMLSDWDLGAALLGASDPELILKVDLKPFDTGLEEWDIIEQEDVVLANVQEKQRERNSAIARMPLIAQMGERFLNSNNLRMLPFIGAGLRQIEGNGAQANGRPAAKGPLTDSCFRRFLDSEGRLVFPEAFRLAVYQNGVEPSLRPVAWRHLLCIYPLDLTGDQRILYSRRLNEQYQYMKTAWQRKFKAGYLTEEMRLVANMVRKDVLRTDRNLQFYLGSSLEEDDNSNVLALFNVLTTYALCHPEVSYCQGMSDLASPILYVLKDEGDAYVCFCALMDRLQRNFSYDGRTMTQKFKHLEELLQFYDPVLFEYLRECHADDLLFCYRWLLLELKREFAFDDALMMLEVMWSTLPPTYPQNGTTMKIFDVDVSTDPRPLSLTLAGWPQQQQQNDTINSINVHNSPIIPSGQCESMNRYSSSDYSSDSTSIDSGPEEEDEDGLDMGVQINGIISSSPHHKLSETTLTSENGFAENSSTPVARPYADFTMADAPQFFMTPPKHAVDNNAHERPLPGDCLLKARVRKNGDATDADSDDDWLMHSSYPPNTLRHWLICSVRDRIQSEIHSSEIKHYDVRSSAMTGHCASFPTPHGLFGSLQLAQEHSDGSRSITPEPKVQIHKHPSEMVPILSCPTFRYREEPPVADSMVETDSVPSSEDQDDAVVSITQSRVVKPSDETTVHDNGLVMEASPRKSSTVRVSSGSSPKERLKTPTSPIIKSNEISPVPVANDATLMFNTYPNSYGGGELKLSDIYDLVLNQSLSVQSSGEMSGSRSRHVSAAETPTVSSSSVGDTDQNKCGDRNAGDSGISSINSKSTSAMNPVYKNGDGSVGSRSLGGATSIYTQSVALASTSSLGFMRWENGVSSGSSAATPANRTPHASVEFINVEKDPRYLLPPPHEFGDGNPFMLFICLTLLLSHRDSIMKGHMDYNDIAMLFDKLVRKHDVKKVLHRARIYYADYLKSGWLSGED